MLPREEAAGGNFVLAVLEEEREGERYRREARGEELVEEE